MSLTLLVTLVLFSVVCLWVVGLGVFFRYWAREEAKTFARVKATFGSSDRAGRVVDRGV